MWRVSCFLYVTLHVSCCGKQNLHAWFHVFSFQFHFLACVSKSRTIRARTFAHWQPVKWTYTPTPTPPGIAGHKCKSHATYVASFMCGFLYTRLHVSCCRICDSCFMFHDVQLWFHVSCHRQKECPRLVSCFWSSKLGFMFQVFNQRVWHSDFMFHVSGL